MGVRSDDQKGGTKKGTHLFSRRGRRPRRENKCVPFLVPPFWSSPFWSSAAGDERDLQYLSDSDVAALDGVHLSQILQ